MSTLQLNILNQLNNLVIVLNRDTSVEYISPSAAIFFGFEADLLLGEGWWKYTKETQEQAEGARNEMIELFNNTNFNNEFERKVITNNGDVKWVLWKMTQLAEGKLVGIGNDITKRKNLEIQVEFQNKILEERSSEILDSIEYASNIQQSILPDIDIAKTIFSDAFLLFKPKDIVSGDFYWQYVSDDVIVSALIDCTGHGVPGALVTIMANAAFNDIVERQKVYAPDEILYKLDESITKTLNDRSSITRLEGMDVSVSVFDKSTNILKYAGAFRPIYLIRDNELMVYEGSKNPIGYYFELEKSFQCIDIETKKGDTFYMFSDGYTDQFGGEKIKKFNRKRFKTLLLSLQDYTLKRQEKELESAFDLWKGKSEQIDDVSVVGLRV
jgi:PAS domain S-box-containing protein